MTHEQILFDLDGTLSDPVLGIGRSINFASNATALRRWPRGGLALDRPTAGREFRAITGRDDDATIHALVAAYRERYGDIGYAENVVYDGVPEALAALADAGLAMGLVTSKRRDFGEKILALFQLDRYFRFVDGGEIGVQKWQQIEALRERGVVGPKAVMVGDRAVDLIAAHRNGLAGAGVLWGHGSREELLAESPRYLFRRAGAVDRLVHARLIRRYVNVGWTPDRAVPTVVFPSIGRLCPCNTSAPDPCSPLRWRRRYPGPRSPVRAAVARRRPAPAKTSECPTRPASAP
jgi:phosphoglycolate phosphatase